MKHLRIGGVPEHFNLPWLLAIEEGAFAQLGVELEWVEIGGGTGAIMAQLEAGEIDLATPLTEGAITAIAAGNPSRLVRVWVDSPLLWGIHVAAASTAKAVGDLEGGRFAISRFGSGSELMSRVLAEDLGWSLDDDSFVEVGNLAGALRALPEGSAEIFLWNKSMTQPHVDAGSFGRIDVVPTPWPSFVIAATEATIDRDRDLLEIVCETAAQRAAALAADETAGLLVADRYGLTFADVAAWLGHVRWTPSGSPIDVEMLDSVMQRMVNIGRIPSPIDVRSLLA